MFLGDMVLAWGEIKGDWWVYVVNKISYIIFYNSGVVLPVWALIQTM